MLLSPSEKIIIITGSNRLVWFKTISHFYREFIFCVTLICNWSILFRNDGFSNARKQVATEAAFVFEDNSNVFLFIFFIFFIWSLVF